MRRRLLVPVLAGVLASALGAGLAGCGPPAERAQPAADLQGARFVVGGGPTDELQILCQLTVASVEAAGAQASDQCARSAARDVGLPPERSFVDTGWAYPAEGPAEDPAEGQAEDPAAGDEVPGVSRLAPASFSGGDAVVVTPQRAQRGARTVSDLAGEPSTLCVAPGSDAVDRLADYRLPAEVRTLDDAAVLVAVTRGDCTAGVVPATSGRVAALGLVPLADDRAALARPGAAPILRSELLARHPGVAAVLGTVTPRLTDETMRALNREVGQDGRDARSVARDWLRAEGLI